MAHVQITGGVAGAPSKIIVDGVDLSFHVYDQGLSIVRVGDDPDMQAWGVQMIIAADVLDVDLPEAVILATRAVDDHA